MNMKKYLSMIAFVIMAIMMAFTLQSCGDDDNDSLYKIETTMHFDDEGDVLTHEQCEALVMEVAKKGKSNSVYYPSDDAAAEATKFVANALKQELVALNQEFGTAMFTITIKCIKVKDNKQVITYYVTYDDHDWEVSDNKN
jgi:ABC-type Fe3+/spermidine/putrescine transport system ATPase subunit